MTLSGVCYWQSVDDNVSIEIGKYRVREKKQVESGRKKITTVIKITCYPNKYRDFSKEVDARVDMWPMEGGCGKVDTEYYLRDIWCRKLLMDDQRKRDFGVILCGLVYGLFVI